MLRGEKIEGKLMLVPHPYPLKFPTSVCFELFLLAAMKHLKYLNHP